MKRKHKTQSSKQRQSSLRNFDIFRLRGILATLKSIQSRTNQTAPFTAANISITEIIRSLKNVRN